MSLDKSIKPKLSSTKRPTNPESKLAGFVDFAYLALHAECLAFPDRLKLGNATTGKEYLTAVIPALNAGKPFGATPFAKVEIVKNSIKLGSEGDFSKNNTAVKSTVEIMIYGDIDSVGQAALMKGADVHLVLLKYNQDMIWLGDKNVPAKVIKYSRNDDSEISEIKITIEFEPYEPLYLPDSSVIDLAPVV